MVCRVVTSNCFPYLWVTSHSNIVSRFESPLRKGFKFKKEKNLNFQNTQNFITLHDFLKMYLTCWEET